LLVLFASLLMSLIDDGDACGFSMGSSGGGCCQPPPMMNACCGGGGGGGCRCRTKYPIFCPISFLSLNLGLCETIFKSSLADVVSPFLV
jgi:hypothetical protein